MSQARDKQEINEPEVSTERSNQNITGKWEQNIEALQMRDLNSDKGRRDDGKDAGLRRGKEADSTELQKAKVEGEEELGSLGEKQTCEDQLWKRGVRSTRLSAFI